MLGIITGVGGWLVKMGIGTIASKLAQAYAEKENAETEQARIKADTKIAMLEARRDVLVAESGHRFAVSVRVIMRLLFAVPVALYYGKIWIWDKVLALGATDPLSDELVWTARIIIAFYFLAEYSDRKRN